MINDKIPEITEKEVELNDILDKLILLKENNKPSFLKKTIYVVLGASVIIFVVLLCSVIYKNEFTLDSILSTMLAFFSIFISIFFYFKADETSTRFYESSYKFMKEISVTLGKIEERFGEKLNSLNDKISHLDTLSKEASEEIEGKQEDKDSIIEELMEKANLNEEEKLKYKQEIEAKEKEIEDLKAHRFRAEREAAFLRHRIGEKVEESVENKIDDKEFLIRVLMDENYLEHSTVRSFMELKRRGFIDSEGKINRNKIINVLSRYN